MRALYLALGRDLAAADAGATHTVNIVKALGECGVQIELAAAGEPRGGVPEGVRFIRSQTGKVGRFTGLGQVESEVGEAAGRADIIQERAEESGGVGVRLAKSTGKPLVLEINTPLSGYVNPLVRQIADWNLRRQAQAADAIITQTPISRNIIEEYTSRQVYVVPNGADPGVFDPLTAAREIPGGARRRVVGFAGSLRPWHGVEDLIAAGRQILRRHGEAFFLIVGGGIRQKRLRAAAEATLGKGNYHFTGAVNAAEVPSWLSAAEVLAAPFAPARDRIRRGQFARHGMWWSPVKIFEYMAMGKPIVAAAAGMVPEYTAGAALTFEPGDVAGLAECVCKLLEDAPLARGLAKTARERFAANFTWRKAAEQTLAAWEEVPRNVKSCR